MCACGRDADARGHMCTPRARPQLAEDWEALPRCFETSSRTGAGKSELLGYVASLRELHVRNGGP